MQFLTLGLGSLEQGLIYAIMAIGVFVSLRILDIPDLTVDGSFITGAAVSVMITNMQPSNDSGLLFAILSLVLALLAGAVAGMITGILQTKLKVQPLLAGILTMTGLYSINLMIMGEKPTVNINGKTSIFSDAQAFGVQLLGDLDISEEAGGYSNTPFDCRYSCRCALLVFKNTDRYVNKGNRRQC